MVAVVEEPQSRVRPYEPARPTPTTGEGAEASTTRGGPRQSGACAAALGQSPTQHPPSLEHSASPQALGVLHRDVPDRQAG
eukprot:scaffold84_cov388-Prasinococcus_capsulatus_cf.AAC.2